MKKEEKIVDEETNIRIDKPKLKKEKKKVDKSEEEILKLTELLGQEKEKSMRIQAEMMNFKRRKEEESATLKKYANEDILKELLLVSDNFERALMMENEENKEFLKGFRMISDNIKKILSDNGVTEIDALNKEFDPSIHQAVLTETKEGVDPGIVIDVLQKGYMYKDRVLRPSMVKVSE